MKQSEAKSQIIRLWLSRPEESRNENETAKFAWKILKERPDLTSFRCVGDRYQIIKSWLMQQLFPIISYPLKSFSEFVLNEFPAIRIMWFSTLRTIFYTIF